MFTTVTVGSVTYAIKVKRILQKMRIWCELVKVESKNAGSGCEYGVSFPSSELYSVVSELKARGISYTLR